MLWIKLCEALTLVDCDKEQLLRALRGGDIRSRVRNDDWTTETFCPECWRRSVDWDCSRLDLQRYQMIILDGRPTEPPKPNWVSVEINREDLLACFPLRPAAPASEDLTIDPRHTGFPGRPSKGKHLIERECQRRMEAGEMLPLLTDEAKALLAWYIANYPQMPRPTAHTIENNIRELHRRTYPRN